MQYRIFSHEFIGQSQGILVISMYENILVAFMLRIRYTSVEELPFPIQNFQFLSCFCRLNFKWLSLFHIRDMTSLCSKFHEKLHLRILFHLFIFEITITVQSKLTLYVSRFVVIENFKVLSTELFDLSDYRIEKDISRHKKNISFRSATLNP